MISWISVALRVPDDRREVLVWGVRMRFSRLEISPRFLGITRFNAGRNGGRWDCEKPRHILGIPLHQTVTHWAEIEGPRAWVIAPPEQPLDEPTINQPQPVKRTTTRKAK